MAATYWIKLYHEILHDPKMGRLPDKLWRRVIEIFLIAGEAGEGGRLPLIEDMAWTLRADEVDLTADLEALAVPGVEIVKLIDGRWFVVKFADRQGPVGGAERVQQYRERKRKEEYYGNEQATEMKQSGNEVVTKRYAESDTDTESDNGREKTASEKFKDKFTAEYEMGMLTGSQRHTSIEAEQDLKRAGWKIQPDEVRWAVACFLAASALPIPFDKPARKDWYATCKEHLETFGLEGLKRLYPPAVKQMRDDRMVVARPGALTKTLADLYAREAPPASLPRSDLSKFAIPPDVRAEEETRRAPH